MLGSTSLSAFPHWRAALASEKEGVRREGRVSLAQAERREARSKLTVLRGRLTDLPWSPYFVSECDVLDSVRLRVAILPTHLRPVGGLSRVHVLEPVESGFEGAGAHVETYEGLSSELVTPLHELEAKEVSEGRERLGEGTPNLVGTESVGPVDIRLRSVNI